MDIAKGEKVVDPVDVGIAAKQQSEAAWSQQVNQNQADAAAMGVTIPGSTYKPAIVGSSSVVMDRNAQTATTAAGNAATASSTPTPNNGQTTGSSGSGSSSVPDPSNAISDNAQSALDVLNKNTGRLISAQQLSYNASLGANNEKYAQLSQQLQQNYERSMGSAAQTAASLNPYSSATQATTAANFMNRITSDHQTAAAQLQAQADSAQQALDAGNYSAYVQIQNGLDAGVQKIQSDTQNALLDFAKQQQQQSNFEATFNQNASKAAQDDFMSYLNTVAGSPQLQTETQAFLQTGKATPGVQGIIDRGTAAGMSPQEALSIFSYGTDKVRQAQAMENYRNEQLVLSQSRLALAQAGLVTQQNVGNVSKSLMDQGIKPGTPEYAQGIAAATAGSTKALPSARVDTYTNLGVLSSQLDGLKTSIDKVDTKSDTWNIIASHAGASAQSISDSDLAYLNGQIQALSGILGKSVFGESGNLSNSDIQRVLGALPSGATTDVVRDALYKNIVDLMANKASLTLQNDANNGYNVANYGPVVQDIVDKAKAITTGPGAGGTGTTFQSPGGKTYTLPF